MFTPIMSHVSKTKQTTSAQKTNDTKILTTINKVLQNITQQKLMEYKSGKIRFEKVIKKQKILKRQLGGRQ